MKKLIILVLIVLVAFLFIKKASNNNLSHSAETAVVSIAKIRSHPEIYADSLVSLPNLTVLSSHSLMNYCKIVLIDSSGKQIEALTNRPYRKGQLITKLTGHLSVLYQSNKKSYEVFIGKDMKPIRSLFNCIKESLRKKQLQPTT